MSGFCEEDADGPLISINRPQIAICIPLNPDKIYLLQKHETGIDTRMPPAKPTPLVSEPEWAARLRGFGPLGILVTLAIPFAGNAFIGAILVLLWARLSRTSWREIDYVRPIDATV